MAIKVVELPDVGTVHLYKRKGVRSIRLSIDTKGKVRVMLPYWLPYEAGLTFARSRQDWIVTHTSQNDQHLIHGQVIGKSHRLVFEKTPAAAKVATRVTASIVYITHPATRPSSDSDIQAAAHKASIRALRAQAEAALPGRLRQLAEYHGFEYRGVQIKQMTGRWGSCDSQRNIVLNLFLMQLPWELIDYVILHELVHTEVMKHGPVFWEAMARVLPDVQRRRKAMKSHRPAIAASPSPTA